MMLNSYCSRFLVSMSFSVDTCCIGHCCFRSNLLRSCNDPAVFSIAVSYLHRWYDVLFYSGIDDSLALFSTSMQVKLNFRWLVVLKHVELPSASSSSATAMTASSMILIVVSSHGVFFLIFLIIPITINLSLHSFCWMGSTIPIVKYYNSSKLIKN